MSLHVHGPACAIGVHIDAVEWEAARCRGYFEHAAGRHVVELDPELGRMIDEALHGGDESIAITIDARLARRA